MYKIKSIDIGNHTYCFGCVTNYELTEQEKEHRRYFVKQKAIGFTFATLMILPAIIMKEPKVLLLTGIFVLLGLAVALTDQRVTG